MTDPAHHVPIGDTGGWSAWADRQVAGITAAGRWREVRAFDAAGPVGCRDGQSVTSFASNDYLGLSHHPAVAAAAIDAIERWGTGAGASRLVVGSRPVHHDLESALAAWKGTEAALVFPTGYAANLGVLTTFGHAGAHILSDELNHASIVDGCRLAKAEVTVYPHADLPSVAELLAADLASGRPSLVVTDAVFSMDGDLAPLVELAECCVAHRALLVVDEAHDVFHASDALAGVPGLDWLRVGTLSKTLGSLGGFVAADRRSIDLLVNRARPFIFTTALSPADAAAAGAALAISVGPEGDRLRGRLRAAIDRIAPGAPSPIIPIVLGSEDAAVAAADRLLADGLLVPAIRPPTVPPGTSRLRVALSAAHDEADVGRLATALDGLRSAEARDEHGAGNGQGGLDVVGPAPDRTRRAEVR